MQNISSIEIRFQFYGQTPLAGFRREMPKPSFAIFTDLKRKARQRIYQLSGFTSPSIEQC